MDPKVVEADARAAEIAARQHGVATVTQLVDAGLSHTAVKNRVRAGRLHRIHRGVYAVGHRGLSKHGRWIAAVLACGEGAVLSHRSAAELWDLLPTTTGIVPPARTLADLRRTIAPGQFRKAVREAEFRGLHLGDAPTDHTRSELERAFLRLCRRYRLPTPEVNVRVGQFTVDFLWREQWVVVETDGYAAHRGSQGFEDDHERELELHMLGYRLRRFTDRQVRRQPRRVAVAIETALRGL